MSIQLAYREEVSVDLAAVDGPGLPAVQLVQMPVLLDEGDEVKVNLVIQRRGLEQKNTNLYFKINFYFFSL